MNLSKTWVCLIVGVPWLLLPGLCCIGIAGLGTLATNLQVNIDCYTKSISASTFRFISLFECHISNTYKYTNIHQN